MPTLTVLPTSTYETNDWTGAATDVDEGCATHDSDTTYVYQTGTTGYRITFNGTTPAITSTSINKLTVKAVLKYITAAPASLSLGIWTWTTARLGSNITPTTSYAEYSNDWLTNPATGAAWTEDEIEGTDATSTHRWRAASRGFFVNGDQNTGGTTRVTAIEAVVDYNVASSSAVKSVMGLADASVKSVNGLARASVKTVMGLA